MRHVSEWKNKKVTKRNKELYNEEEWLATLATTYFVEKEQMDTGNLRTTAINQCNIVSTMETADPMLMTGMELRYDGNVILPDFI